MGVSKIVTEFEFLGELVLYLLLWFNNCQCSPSIAPFMRIDTYAHHKQSQALGDRGSAGVWESQQRGT